MYLQECKQNGICVENTISWTFLSEWKYIHLPAIDADLSSCKYYLHACLRSHHILLLYLISKGEHAIVLIHSPVLGDKKKRKGKYTKREGKVYKNHKVIFNHLVSWPFGPISKILNEVYGIPKDIFFTYNTVTIQYIFDKIKYNLSHPLYHLLPKKTDHSYSLRSRSHNFELTHTHDNRNFIDRMLFYPYHIS